MSNLESFIAAAREFSQWCVSPCGKEGDEADEARNALAQLLRLYTLALDLRFPDDMDCEIDGETASDAVWKKVYKRAHYLPFSYYSSVFDPQVVPPEEPGAGDLADDIADIYRDLYEGLTLVDSGHPAEAECAFVNSFRSHWGRHASSAIYALHCWFADTGNW